MSLQQYRLPLNLKEDVLSDPVNAWEGHDFAGCFTKVCGDIVKWDHCGCLACFEGDPDLCGWIQSFDVMKIT